ncbi:NO-inducible flavohemoprotein [Oceanicella sp. SM1341]|uniref:NO-inducible flavohemoprotein n=1 Tax=Oceanicella sp. SM1341 TaxID=1548889 RepID=UPI000E46ADAB|nr:NO-inducible flavohemoprotein [Oceanicella sp. SM1341]
MPRTLSPETIALVKATVPAIAAHGSDITRTMYAKLFEDAHIRALFNHSNQESGAQVNALAAAILAYARHIETPQALGPVVERIAHKHIGYSILPEHYPYVARALIRAIEEVLGAAATPEILAAWGEAYWFLAEVLMEREEVLRAELLALEGGWTGWRRFEVAERRPESEVITSFVLRPADGGPVVRHRPGQYLTLRFDMPEQQGAKRNYSISSAPSDSTYRISVKREAAGQGGSRHLHDRVEVGDVLDIAPPAGDFFLPERPERPVILLSGGVGVTPMIAMAETIAEAHPGLETHFVHGALNSAVHAMAGHVRGLAARHGRIRATTFYSAPLPQDVLGASHDAEGFISVDWLAANTPLGEADVFLCGPKPFLRGLITGLQAAGVAPARIHHELFGPTDEAVAA